MLIKDSSNPEASPTPHVEFRHSFPFLIIGTLATLSKAPRYEGFDQWIYVTFAALEEDVRRDILWIVGPLGVPILLQELLNQQPEIGDLSALLGWIAAIPDDAIHQGVVRLFEELARKASTHEAPLAVPTNLADGERLREFFCNTACEWTELAEANDERFRRIARLIVSPSELKAQLVLAITRFWESYYQPVHAECDRLAQRSVRGFETVVFSGGLPATFAQVTGRPLPSGMAGWMDHLEHLIFIPNCFTGPFVQFVPMDSAGRVLALLYNCRPDSESAGIAESVRDLFAPLRALADETRLEILAMLVGRELYAQQIVSRMEISQPAVSRHLSLLVAAGVLNLRKQDGMKFYSLSEESLTVLGSRLLALGAASQPDSDST